MGTPSTKMTGDDPTKMIGAVGTKQTSVTTLHVSVV